MFHEIPDAVAITRQNGIFRQCKVFRYNDRIFIRHGAGFIWVLNNGDTSCPTVRVEEIELPFAKVYSRVGYLVHPESDEAIKSTKGGK